MWSFAPRPVSILRPFQNSPHTSVKPRGFQMWHTVRPNVIGLVHWLVHSVNQDVLFLRNLVVKMRLEEFDHGGTCFGLANASRNGGGHFFLVFLRFHLATKQAKQERNSVHGLFIGFVSLQVVLGRRWRFKALVVFVKGQAFAHCYRGHDQVNGRSPRRLVLHEFDVRLIFFLRVTQKMSLEMMAAFVRKGLWPKAFLHAMLLENIILPKRKEVSSHKAFHGEDYKGLYTFLVKLVLLKDLKISSQN